MRFLTMGSEAFPTLLFIPGLSASEALMLPVFLYWFWLQIRGETVFPKGMAFTNVLILFALLKALSLLMPVSAFRLGFTNGLMSESMILWFGIMLAWERRRTVA